MSENNPAPSSPVCSCGCVGYGYVPVQYLDETYLPDKGLMQGTIFPELDLTIDEYGYVCKKKGGVL